MIDRFIFCVFLLAGVLFSTPLAAQRVFEIPVWPDGAPDSNGVCKPESSEKKYGHVFNVSEAILKVYVPEHVGGTALIACPGGGYELLSMKNEGEDWAAWMNARNVVYAVLKYRIPNGNHQVPMRDVEEAVRILRMRKQEWGIKKVGVMGFSAGGHLASFAATRCAGFSRPDFQVLFYPVISMQEDIRNGWTFNSLLGKTPADTLVNYFSNEMHVDTLTPPAFIVHCCDDGGVSVENSIRYFQALRRHGVAVSLHIYPSGGHGWGFSDRMPCRDLCLGELADWLRRLSMDLK